MRLAADSQCGVALAALLVLAACSSSGVGSGAPSLTRTSDFASAANYIPAAAAEPSTGARLTLGKCVNMGNMLEAPSEGAWGRAVANDDFSIVREAGFDSVRVPVRWSAHASSAPPYTIDPAFLARVKEVVGTAEAEGLGVILNLHHYEELFEDPAAHRDRFAAIWQQVAAEFQDSGDRVWFELLNEPHNILDDNNLLSVLEPALANVRATNPTRPVIIGGENWSGVGSLATLPMPEDPHLVPTFHTYDPFDFTHQGATWTTPVPPLGQTFGSPADIAALNENLRAVQAYMARTGRVPFIGEYGAIDHPEVPLAERIEYYRTISAAYASIGVQSCAWSYTNTFRLRDSDGWLPGMVEAIATTTSR